MSHSPHARTGPPQGGLLPLLVTLLLLPGVAGCLMTPSPPLMGAASLMRLRQLDNGCPSLASLDGSQTPDRLYRGVAPCLRSADQDTAVVLFGLAAAYGRFDAKRVADPSAHQASTLLRLVALQELDASQRQALSQGMAAALARPAGRPNLCATVERIGPPTYRPDYMLRHGLAQLKRDVTGAGADTPAASGGLVEGFDANAAWNEVLDDFLRCGKA
jgi:hypothetical protein